MEKAYPFHSHFLEVGPGKIHYIDEGQGKPILFLHGNPDWSFSFRKVIKGLRTDYRCIAPDHIGFGLSEKPINYSYEPWDMAKHLEKLIDHLALKHVTLVVNDWGGPIGFDYCINHPDRVSNIIIMNTWLWPLNNYPLFWVFSKLMSGKTGNLLTGKLNLFSTILLWLAVYDKKSFRGKVHEYYQWPFKASQHRKASIALPHYLMAGKHWFQKLWENRNIIQAKNTLLIWGLKDPAFGKHFLRKWQNLLPDSRSVSLVKAGHFPQECQSEMVTSQIKHFLAQSNH